MKISVVTVAFNARRTIGWTLQSVFDQTYPDKELLVIDGASTDGTLDLVSGHAEEPGLKVISEPDDGLYQAMNKGLAAFSGDAVGFLNADDRFHDRFALERIAEALADHDIVFGNIDILRDHGRGQIVRRWRGSSYRPGAFRDGWMPAHPSFYVRRRVVEAVGDFDEDLSISADYDWMLRAFERNGFSSVFLDRPLVDMAAGGQSSRSPLAFARSNLQALRSRRRWLGAGLVDPALVLKPMRKLSQWIR